MNQLAINFTADNNTFTQIKRNDKAAVYRRETLEGSLVSFEVFAIRTKNGSEIYPNVNAVNKWLFAPTSETRANVWFDRINNGEISNFENYDPETGAVMEVVDERSLDELPDVDMPVAVETSTIEKPTNDSIDFDGVSTETVEIETKIEKSEAAKETVSTDAAAVTEVKPIKNKVNYTIPAGEFTANQFADANGLRRRKGVWGRIQSEIEAGRVKLVAQKKVGKGRPTSFYTSVAQVA